MESGGLSSSYGFLDFVFKGERKALPSSRQLDRRFWKRSALSSVKRLAKISFLEFEWNKKAFCLTFWAYSHSFSLGLAIAISSCSKNFIILASFSSISELRCETSSKLKSSSPLTLFATGKGLRGGKRLFLFFLSCGVSMSSGVCSSKILSIRPMILN